jgi:hypothetical protein
VGNERGRATRSIGLHARRLGSVVALGGLVVATALSALPGCSGGGDGSSVATTGGGDTSAVAPADGTAPDDAGLLPCAEDRHGVVVDVGALTFGTGELAKWLADPSYDMAPRPGATDLLAAYRFRGYQIVYLTGLASDGVIGPNAVPLTGEITAWLTRHGMPTGEGTQLLMWDKANFADPTAYRIDALVRLSLDGLSLDYGYTDDKNDVRAMTNGGVPLDHIFTIQGDGGTPGTEGTLEQDWATHKVRVVDPLPAACTL